ncbi:hypothetical protein [Alteromonas gracilis]|uniref:hypothetical protein n=1 Tax=Alteromonas gracilis TaxID=1479524 RepID=UPI00321AFBD5
MLSSVDQGPDYTRYSIEELEDVLENIEQRAYSDRYAAAQAALAQKKSSAEMDKGEQIEGEDTDEPFVKPKWSERHVVTRCCDIVILVLFLGPITSLFADFSVTNSWLDNSSWAIYALALLVGWLWFTSLYVDKLQLQHLNSSVRGKISIVTMPLLGALFSWFLVDNTLPYALHSVSTTHVAEHKVKYRKGDSAKRCRYKVLLEDTKTLSHDRLCLAAEEFKRLPRKGTLVLKGAESAYGFNIESYQLSYR